MHIYWWLSHDSYYLHGSDSISLVLNSDSALNYVAICQKYVLLYSLYFRATIWMIFFQIEVFNHQQASDMYFPWKLRLVQEQAIKSIGRNHWVRSVWQKHHHLAALSQTTRSSCITLSSDTPLDVFLIRCISHQVYFLNSAHMANAITIILFHSFELDIFKPWIWNNRSSVSGRTDLVFEMIWDDIK